AFDVLAEIVSILEVEHVLARTLGGHRELEALRAGFLGDAPAELLVGEHRGLLRVGLALDPEELLLERAAVVEGEDVELLLVAELHRSVSFGSRWYRLARAPTGQLQIAARTYWTLSPPLSRRSRREGQSPRNRRWRGPLE